MLCCLGRTLTILTLDLIRNRRKQSHFMEGKRELLRGCKASLKKWKVSQARWATLTGKSFTESGLCATYSKSGMLIKFQNTENIRQVMLMRSLIKHYVLQVKKNSVNKEKGLKTIFIDTFLWWEKFSLWIRSTRNTHNSGTQQVFTPLCVMWQVSSIRIFKPRRQRLWWAGGTQLHSGGRSQLQTQSKSTLIFRISHREHICTLFL